MEIILTKRYLCVLCERNEILHKCDEKMLDEGCVPDISSCDFSSYSNPHITGGLLFEIKNRPRVVVESGALKTVGRKKPPIGGICDICLEKDDIRKLISAHLLHFDDNPGTFRRNS